MLPHTKFFYFFTCFPLSLPSSQPNLLVVRVLPKTLNFSVKKKTVLFVYTNLNKDQQSGFWGCAVGSSSSPADADVEVVFAVGGSSVCDCHRHCTGDFFHKHFIFVKNQKSKWLVSFNQCFLFVAF